MPEQESALNVKPMLCKSFIEGKHGFGGCGYIVEPKFDGLRCVLFITGSERKAVAYSRNGKPFWNIDHILHRATALGFDIGLSNLVLDGELFATDWNLSMGVVKSSKTTHPEAHKIKFHVWDMLYINEWEAGQSYRNWSQRQETLTSLLDKTSNPCILRVKGEKAYNLDEARNIYQKFLEQGYEGAVLKNPLGLYQLGKRSPDWLKWKPVSDVDLTIVDAVEGVGKRTGMIGALKVMGTAEWNDKSYSVETEVGSFHCPDAQLIDMWNMYKDGQLVGKVAEIQIWGITVEGACRNPVFHRLRDDKSSEIPIPAKKMKGKKATPAAIIDDPEKVEEYFDRL